MARKQQAPGKDFIERVHRLTNAAEVYVNRSPHVKRLDAERSVLLEALADLQLALSVQRLPTVSATERPAPRSDSQQTARLEAAVQQAEARMAGWQRSLRPLSDEIETLQASLDRAKALLDTLHANERHDEAA